MLNRWSALALTLSLTLVTGCGEKQPPAPAEPAPTEPAPAEPVPTDPAPTDPAEPAPAAAAAEDWILWFHTPEGYRSRWITATEDAFEVVADKGAPILSDGARLFRIVRKDVTIDVSSCACVDEEEGSADCKVIATLAVPGLVAVDLEGGRETAIRVADAEPTIGEGLDASVDLHGGVGTRLFTSWTFGGYMCGAHGGYEGNAVQLDLATGEALTDVAETLKRRLPAPLLAEAARGIRSGLAECEGDDEDVTLERATEEMSFSGLHVGLDARGEVVVTWRFAADVMYACSADYSVVGQATSGLLPEAEVLGLTGPLPAGVKRALAAIESTATIGWSKLALTGEARDAALARFKAAPEPTWGPSHASTQPTAAAAADGRRDAQKKVDAGRKLTSAKKYAEARGEFLMAIQLDESHAAARSGLGYVLLLEGELDGAKAAFEEALARDDAPTFQAQVLYNLGQVAEKQRDVAAARLAYRRSLALRPNDAVQKALGRLE